MLERNYRLGEVLPEAEPDPLASFSLGRLRGVVLSMVDGDELDDDEEDAPGSRLMVLESVLEPAEPEPVADEPVEELGELGGVEEVELEEEGLDGAVAVPEEGGVLVDELEAPGPPVERSTRSSPQPTSATATADAASNNLYFCFMCGLLADYGHGQNGPRRRIGSATPA